MSVVRRGLVLALLAAASVASAQTPETTIPVRAGASLTPDTVRIGDPFVVRVRVRAPAGAQIEFPPSLDSAGTVQSLDPVSIATTTNGPGGVDQTASYRVAAWDVDSQTVRLDDVVVHAGPDERRVPITGLRVYVKSVLPADSALRVPKPARPPFDYSFVPWWLVAAIAAAVAVVGLLFWWWWRRRRRRGEVEEIVDPYTRAQRDFDRIERLKLLEAGERGRYVALVVETLRDYLAARYPSATLALTSSELLRAVRDERHIPRDRLGRLLEEADLVKFARRPLSSDRARELGREARGIVDEEHARSTPAPETEKAA